MEWGAWAAAAGLATARSRASKNRPPPSANSANPAASAPCSQAPPAPKDSTASSNPEKAPQAQQAEASRKDQAVERNASNHFEIVKKQLEESLFHLSEIEFTKLIIAYEPVWAIGTGKTASCEQAQEMHQHIRALINTKYGKDVSSSISILYGGSCNAQNAKEIFSCEDVDGGLIGGASLKAEDFVSIANSF